MKLKHLLVHFALQKARNKVKKKGTLLGQRFVVPRAQKKSAEVYLYRPAKPALTPMPTVFNAHGGGWVGCDATYLDTQSQTLADMLGCLVVNINYTKLDVQPFPYPQEEIRDTVLFFRDHAREYGLDTSRFTLAGYSAGGHLSAGAAMLLRDTGFELNSQFLCYPFLSFTEFYAQQEDSKEKTLNKAAKRMDEIFFSQMDKNTPLLSPAAADVRELQNLAPAEILTCGKDVLLSHAIAYEQKLKEAGVPAVRKDFVGSLHGFLEVNFPETKENGAKSPEQEALMKEAMGYIRQRAHAHWEIQED